MPELDFVEVAPEEAAEPKEEGSAEDFEFFPLFATEELTKVDLTEPEPSELVEVPQERPRSYYFAEYSDAQLLEFKDAAVSYETLVQMGQTPYRRYHESVMDLKQHNEVISAQNKLDNPKRKRRPGKNQRVARQMAKVRVQERDELKKALKKKVRKRGGKKNKKKAKMNPLANAGAVQAEA